jgi:hypothetical protein
MNDSPEKLGMKEVVYKLSPSHLEAGLGVDPPIAS